jgi:hypothetical protein
VIGCVVAGRLEPQGRAERLRAIVGVVEHGLFLDSADEVIVGGSARVTTMSRRSRRRAAHPASTRRSNATTHKAALKLRHTPVVRDSPPVENQ